LLVSRSVSGYVRLQDGAADSVAELRIPVDSLLVDDPALRESAGKAFASEITATDIAAVRNLIMGKTLLDAAGFPDIHARATVVGGTAPDIELEIELAMRGRKHSLRAPARIEVRDKELIANGEFTLRLGDFGMAPPKLLMGALTVKDEIRAEYRIRALP
jgi:polyisoprenoid-binding protein YceI